jgi:hypothetical protein
VTRCVRAMSGATVSLRHRRRRPHFPESAFVNRQCDGDTVPHAVITLKAPRRRLDDQSTVSGAQEGPYRRTAPGRPPNADSPGAMEAVLLRAHFAMQRAGGQTSPHRSSQCDTGKRVTSNL